MGRYHVKVHWQKSPDEPFNDNKYSRKHQWHFDGGIKIPASSSPQVVPEPYSDSSAIDPEETFVASLSSCHMLWFLSLAAKKGYIIEEYKDEAIGIMDKNPAGKLAITEVILKPLVSFKNDYKPHQQIFYDLHKQAHSKCFIAHSVKTEITIDAHIA